MIKIKMLTTSAGPDGCHVQGEVYPEKENVAKELVEGGYAVYAEPLKKGGGKDGLPVETNNPTGSGAGKSGGSKTGSKGNNK